MNYEPFLELCSQKDYDIQFINNICNTLGDNYDQTSAVFQAFFLRGTTMSREKFFKVKRVIKELMSWLLSKNLITEEYCKKISAITIDDVTTDEAIRTNYFEDLNSVLDFVTAIGRFVGMDSENDLLQIKSIVVLAWFGVSRTEMVNVQKGDLSAIDNSVYISSDRRTIQLDKRSFDILHRYANIDIHKDFPSASRSRTLQPSIYLMRSYAAKKLSENNLSSVIKKFNNVVKDLELKNKRTLGINSLNDNRIFCEMFDGKVNIKSERLHMNSSQRSKYYWYLRMYKYWLDVYHPADTVMV